VLFGKQHTQQQASDLRGSEERSRKKTRAKHQKVNRFIFGIKEQREKGKSRQFPSHQFHKKIGKERGKKEESVEENQRERERQKIEEETGDDRRATSNITKGSEARGISTKNTKSTIFVFFSLFSLSPLPPTCLSFILQPLLLFC
jgi:hypothetical protein